MAIKVLYSTEYWAKRKRIQRLPKIMGDVVSGFVKRDLIQIKETFHEGIKNNTLGLERLVGETIRRKKRKGYSRPTSPLYGKGDKVKEGSYTNMLEITKKGNGWILKPSQELHWSGALKLSELFNIHEHGATIKRSTKDGEVLIKIPPRPALLLSYRRHLIRKRRVKKERSKEVREAMSLYINKGSEKKVKEFKNWIAKT